MIDYGFWNPTKISSMGLHIYSYPATGFWIVKGTNACGTTTHGVSFKSELCLGNPCITNSKDNKYYTISPNPASDIINIGTTNKPAPVDCNGLIKAINSPKGIIFSLVNIYNSMGVLLKTYKTNNVKSLTIQISDLQHGVYVTEIIQEDYSERHQLIIK